MHTATVNHNLPRMVICRESFVIFDGIQNVISFYSTAIGMNVMITILDTKELQGITMFGTTGQKTTWSERSLPNTDE